MEGAAEIGSEQDQAWHVQRRSALQTQKEQEREQEGGWLGGVGEPPGGIVLCSPWEPFRFHSRCVVRSTDEQRSDMTRFTFLKDQKGAVWRTDWKGEDMSRKLLLSW